MWTNDEQRLAALQWLRERADKHHSKLAAADYGMLVIAESVKPAAPIEQATVLVGCPEMLGENYEEIIETLNRLADANLALVITPRASRDSDGVGRLADEDSWPAPGDQH
jgi:hypothetical protein